MILVDTEAAAVYVQWVFEEQVPLETVRRRIYNLARDGKLTRYGRPGKGNARWDLLQIHEVCARKGDPPILNSQ
ncbi:hypothetical protein ACMA1D_10745 [Streptomyces sp. 796.1]|uniref:hypothetical protein n=1 Tax=Streptomyces sp. 796.1 TaxID=3163029 RepID=UPI0039C8F138